MNKNKALQKAINLHLSGNNVEASKAYNSVLVLDFGGDFTATSGTFTIQFPANDASNAVLRLS